MDNFTEAGRPWKGLDDSGCSYERAVTKFDSQCAAELYPADYKPTAKSQREKRTVQELILRFPPGGRILDLPCGTGRVARLLLEAGYHVTAVDSSQEMVDQCQKNMLSLNHRYARRSEYAQGLADQTGFEDGEFAGVICNRLFHHYREASVRIAVLKELRRICHGPVIVSFANSQALSVWIKQTKRQLLGRKLGDYRPITTATMTSEFHEAGLDVEAAVPVWRGFSRMWYMVGRARQAQRMTA